MENSGKQNPKKGFKSPTEARGESNRPQGTTPSIDFPTEGIYAQNGRARSLL
jgi:hypothetical protein